jgi:hypothetical protein
MLIWAEPDPFELKPKTVTAATATSVNVNGVTTTTGNCGGLHVPAGNVTK